MAKVGDSGFVWDLPPSTFATLKTTASKNGRVTVSARLTMERDKSHDPDWLGTDERVRSLIQKLFYDRFGDPKKLPRSLE